jgi:PAS domain S-box-containing protein
MYDLLKITILFLLALTAHFSYASSPHQILILHSYSQEYPWTQNQHNAFVAKLKASYPSEPIISTEYLDTKRRNFDADYIKSFYEYMAVKYDDYSPDILYVTDDNALSFTLSHLQSLFPQAAIFFSGVNNYDIKASLDRKRVTGVFEKKDILRNLELLNNIDKNAKDILVIGDDSNTYKAIETEVRRQLEKYPDIKATFVASHSIDEVSKQVRDNTSNYVFLTTLGAMKDSSEGALSLNEIMASITSAGSKIVISMEDAYVLDGVLGGYVTSSERQGATAARLVLDYLSGIPVDNQPLVVESPNDYMFNYVEMSAAGISLPESIMGQATILNTPSPFYIRHRSVITGLVVGLAIILILSLSVFLILLSRKNREIQSTSIQAQELEQIVLERTTQLSDERRKLLKAQEIAHIGNYAWDIESDIATWSEELYRIAGYLPNTFEPTYKGYVNCIHPDDRDAFKNLTKKVFNDKSKYDAEYKIIRPDNEIRYVYEQGDVKLDADGKLLGLVGVVHDITERKHSENEYLRLQRELMQAHKMEALGQLTGGIAHDFNNILGIISGFTKLVTLSGKDRLDPKEMRYLENIDMATTRATELVSKMMVFSRDDKGINEPLDFSPAIEESIIMLRSIIPSSIDIKYEFKDGLPPVMMDKTQLHQLLMNLAINAKDAMNGVGKLGIKLAWQRQADIECNACHKHVEGDWIVLSMSDTGSGIAGDVLDRIFEPFYTTKVVGQGTGMGLSVLSAIVEGHGGHIIVDTKIDKGTCFSLLFPPAQIDTRDEFVETASCENNETVSNNNRILIVDDEPLLTEFLSGMLESHGYECTACNESPQALSMVRNNPDSFDLVITDQTMPRLLGSDMITEILKIKPAMPVILTTGHSDTITREQADGLGIQYMEKPVDVSLLMSNLARLLRTDSRTNI